MTAQANWDDLRFVLAVADAGSVAGAARALKVNHATVLRRIAAFETRHGLRIFDKTARGYRIAPDRRALIEKMREAGTALAAVDHMIGEERPAVGASLRITSTDSLCAGPLPEIAADYCRASGLPVDLVAANTHTDFARLQADIAVRPARALPDELQGEAPVAMHFAVFAAKGAPATFIARSGPIARIGVGPDEGAQGLSADSFVTLASLAASGQGRVVLPLFLGRGTAGLMRLADAGLDPVPIWVASHRDIFRSARLVRARAALVQGLRALSAQFEA